MKETKNVKALKKQLAAAIAMVCVAGVALGSSTYAWFASNNSVKAEKMNVTATADVKFLEIQNVGANFTGGTIAVDADEAGSTTEYKLSPVTPMKLTDMTKDGTETTALDVKSSGTNGTEGYGDGLAWKWTTASSGLSANKGAETAWTNADVTSKDAKYYLLNNFKFRMTVKDVTTTNLYASEVTLNNKITSKAMDEAVRVMIVGANGIQIYDAGTKTWSYFNADGTVYNGDQNSFGLISSVAYQENSADGQAVKVFVYYEGDDTELYTANLNSLKGVTANITFTTR